MPTVLLTGTGLPKAVGAPQLPGPQVLSQGLRSAAAHMHARTCTGTHAYTHTHMYTRRLGLDCLTRCWGDPPHALGPLLGDSPSAGELAAVTLNVPGAAWVLQRETHAAACVPGGLADAQLGRDRTFRSCRQFF